MRNCPEDFHFFIIKPLKASKKLIRLLWGGKIRRHPAALTIILKPTVMIEWVQELINHISRLINDNETKFQAKAGLKIYRKLINSLKFRLKTSFLHQDEC